MDAVSNTKTGKSPVGAFYFVSKFLEFGTKGYDSTTARRLRVVNVVCLVLIALFSLQLVSFTVILLVTQQTPFTIGNLSLIAAILITAPTVLFHRYSDIAAAVYFFVVVSMLNFGSLYMLGYAHGNHFGFIALAALIPVFLGNKYKVLSVLLAFCMVGVLVISELYLPEYGQAIADRPRYITQIQRYITIGLMTVAVYVVVRYAFQVAERAEAALEVEYERSESLLRNILPDPIALRLKEKPGDVIADRHEEVTVLFADIVDFTPRATQNPPEEVVALLNLVFSEFDKLAAKYGLEKIKTVGDAYMVVAGIPETHRDGPAAMAEFALALTEMTSRLSVELAETIEVRVGIHTGDAVAGVIGTSKFAYDIWGDTVNTAARMEAFGVPNRIQVTEVVKDALQDRYGFEERGLFDIKGKGQMRLYFLNEAAVEA
ncbi:MAG: adenylate/guanylate cyclase domain-containing protein [Pseudomonadota bacterium]